MLELTLVVLMLADCSTCDVLNTEDVVVVLNIAEEFTVAASPNVVKGAVLELNIDKPFDFLAEANPAVDLPPNDAPFAGMSQASASIRHFHHPSQGCEVLSADQGSTRQLVAAVQNLRAREAPAKQ